MANILGRREFGLCNDLKRCANADCPNLICSTLEQCWPCWDGGGFAKDEQYAEKFPDRYRAHGKYSCRDCVGKNDSFRDKHPMMGPEPTDEQLRHLCPNCLEGALIPLGECKGAGKHGRRG